MLYEHTSHFVVQWLSHSPTHSQSHTVVKGHSTNYSCILLLEFEGVGHMLARSSATIQANTLATILADFFSRNLSQYGFWFLCLLMYSHTPNLTLQEHFCPNNATCSVGTSEHCVFIHWYRDGFLTNYEFWCENSTAGQDALHAFWVFAYFEGCWSMEKS